MKASYVLEAGFPETRDLGPEKGRSGRGDGTSACKPGEQLGFQNCGPGENGLWVQFWISERATRR